MNQQQKDYMDIYITNAIGFVEENDYYAFDYLEIAETNLEELDIPYTKKEWKEMDDHIVKRLQEEFGKQNVFVSKQKNQVVVINGEEKRINAQMVVINN